MEKCVFCNWTRKSALPAIRFFGIPKEPGMRRMQWLYALGKREITSRDRVCSVHFRQGRPSNDASHEDFVPHLYLNKEPPPEVLQYLETLADSKPEKNTNEPEYKASLSMLASNTLELNKAPRPSILRRRKPIELTTGGKMIESATQLSSGAGSEPKRFKLQILQKPLVDAIGGVKHGQTVFIKRKVIARPAAVAVAQSSKMLPG